MLGIERIYLFTNLYLFMIPINSLQVGGGRNPVKYVDCIPMLHINTALAPMAEVALAQVRSDDATFCYKALF